VRISHSDLSTTPGTPNMGHKGLVSKRRDRPYQGGRSKLWIKVENRAHPPMERVMEAFA